MAPPGSGSGSLSVLPGEEPARARGAFGMLLRPERSVGVRRTRCVGPPVRAAGRGLTTRAERGHHARQASGRAEDRADLLGEPSTPAVVI